MQIVERIHCEQVNTTNEKVEWPKIRCLCFQKDEPYMIFYKYAVVDDGFKCIDISKRTIARPRLTFAVNLPLMHPAGCTISLTKHGDITSLMKHVPSCHHAFYQRLKYGGRANKFDVDLDLSFGDSGADEE